MEGIMKTVSSNNRMKNAMYVMMIVLFVAFNINAKEVKSLKGKTKPVEKVEPVPIGGTTSIQNKISYPRLAERLRIEGKVQLQVLVNENGVVEEVFVIKGLTAGCEEAVVNAVKKTKFVPGSQNGKNIKSVYPLTVMFKFDRTGN